MNNILNILEVNILKIFLLTSNLRRVDYNNKFNDISLNIINKFKKLNLSNIRTNNNTKYNDWNSFIIYLILACIKYKIIDEEIGDILLLKYNYRLFNPIEYKQVLYKFQDIISLDNEIYNNHILLILAILSNEDKEHIESFLDGIDETKKEQLIKLITKEY